MSVLAVLIVLIAVVGVVARRVLWHAVRQVGGVSSRKLAPAELAYLIRDGDMPHTLIVMSVDLIHRQIKAGGQDANLALRTYEKQVWVSVKDFMRQLAHQKAGHLVPVDDIKNPVKWAVRVTAIKKFVGETLRSFVTDLIEDPRHIKKYFSLAGIARLAFYFYTSSVRTAVQREMREELLIGGFLIPERRRKRFAKYALALIPLLVLVDFGISYIVMPAAVPLTVTTLILGLVNASAVRLLLELPGFIPTYDEFAKVAAELHRGGWRLNAVRTILRTGKAILVVALLVASAVLILLESLGLNFVYHSFAIPLLVAQSVLGFCVVSCALDAHSLALRDHATASGTQQLEQIRSEIAQIRPLDTFRTTLKDPNYDATLSQLVAVYGIETLWLLS